MHIFSDLRVPPYILKRMRLKAQFHRQIRALLRKLLEEGPPRACQGRLAAGLVSKAGTYAYMRAYSDCHVVTVLIIIRGPAGPLCLMGAIQGPQD